LHTELFLAVFVVMKAAHLFNQRRINNGSDNNGNGNSPISINDSNSNNNDKLLQYLRTIVLCMLLALFLYDDVHGTRASTEYRLVPSHASLNLAQSYIVWYQRTPFCWFFLFLGMLSAISMRHVEGFVRSHEMRSWQERTAVKVCIVVACLVGVSVVFLHHNQDLRTPGTTKSASINLHAHTFIMLILSYVTIRNLTPSLRRCHLFIPRQLGRMSLELYVLQHHLLMSNNGQNLLALIPGWPKINLLYSLLLLVATSFAAHRVTIGLRSVLFDNNCKRALVSFSILALSFVLCSLVVAILHLLGCATAFFLCLFSLILGYTLLTRLEKLAVGESTCENMSDSQSPQRHPLSRSGRILPLFCGSIVVLTFASVYRHTYTTGARRQGAMPSECAELVQNGSWIPALECTSMSRGVAYREHGIIDMVCQPQTNHLVWGWRSSTANTKCHVRQRDSASVHRAIRHKTVVFIGDSIVRHLYHATCRQAGDKRAGMYNTTMGKWTNLARQYNNGTLGFMWAPYSDEAITQLDTFKSKQPRPELIVVGGGLWDRLHRYNSSDERDKIHALIDTLAVKLKELRAIGIPVVWVVPTMINTYGLMTQDKRERIPESEVAIFRELYVNKGVLEAASFVLDGRLFSSGRVSDSYDGVHYPFDVYDAGSQMLLNAFDWLLPQSTSSSRAANDIKLYTETKESFHASIGLIAMLMLTAMLALCSPWVTEACQGRTMALMLNKVCRARQHIRGENQFKSKNSEDGDLDNEERQDLIVVGDGNGNDDGSGGLDNR
jgi:10 TM Acyl Transferase domain found in Cas1p